MSRPGKPRSMTVRGQSNLVAVAAALLAVTAAATLSLAMADLSISGAERPVERRRVAVALSERLVAPTSPLTARANVLDATALADLDTTRLQQAFPVVGDRAVRVRLGDRTLVERGDPKGPTVRRVVLVQRRSAVTLTPNLGRGPVTLPRRTPRVTLHIDPPNGTTVTTVRVGDRVVLHNASGLAGTFTVRTSRYRTVTLSVTADGPLPRGSVAVTYYPAETTKALLEVTVGDD